MQVNELLIYVVLLPLVGVAWNSMTDDGMIFFWYWRLLDNLSSKHKAFEYIVKPLGFCNVCLSGQLAFWVYVFSPIKHEYNIILHLVLTGATIGMVSVLNYITSWLLKD